MIPSAITHIQSADSAVDVEDRLVGKAFDRPLRHAVRGARGRKFAQEAPDLVGGDAGKRHIRAQVSLELSERVGIISHGVRAEVLGLPLHWCAHEYRIVRCLRKPISAPQNQLMAP